jgi:hypothetical protein
MVMVFLESDTGVVKAKRSAISQVISSPAKPTGIEIGDRLRRKSQPQTKYPKAWFPNGIDPRPPTIDAIESATVECLSPDGYWVKTPEGKTYHVSESSIEAGDWELIERNYQQN